MTGLIKYECIYDCGIESMSIGEEVTDGRRKRSIVLLTKAEADKVRLAEELYSEAQDLMEMGEKRMDMANADISVLLGSLEEV